MFVEEPSHTGHILTLISKRDINVSPVQKLCTEVKI